MRRSTSSAPAPTCPNCGARPTRPPILSLMTASRWSRPDASSCCAASAETDGPSVRPGEGREMPIIAPAGQSEVEPESVHLQFLGLSQSETAAGRVPRIVDVERFAAAVPRQDAMDLEREQARDSGAPVVPRHMELDRLVFDAPEIADEVAAGQLRRAARPTCREPGESGAPAGVGTLVHDDAEDPIAVGHDLARAQHERKFAPVEAGSAEIPVIDAEDQDGVAIIVSHRPLRVRIDARAEVVAIAALHVLAADRPFYVCHGPLPDPGIRGAAVLNAEPVAAQRPLPGSVVDSLAGQRLPTSPKP